MRRLVIIKMKTWCGMILRTERAAQLCRRALCLSTRVQSSESMIRILNVAEKNDAAKSLSDIMSSGRYSKVSPSASCVLAIVIKMCVNYTTQELSHRCLSSADSFSVRSYKVSVIRYKLCFCGEHFALIHTRNQCWLCRWYGLWELRRIWLNLFDSPSVMLQLL